MKVMDIPLVRFRDKGTPADNLSNYDSSEEQMIYVSSMGDLKNSALLFVTAFGMCKMVESGEFDVSKRTIASTKLSDDDRLIFVGKADEMDNVVLQSENGYFLRFMTKEVPEKKKSALGVRGIRLGDKDVLSHAYLIHSHTEYSISYKEKQVSLNKLKLAKRDGKGVKIRI